MLNNLLPYKLRITCSFSFHSWISHPGAYPCPNPINFSAQHIAHHREKSIVDIVPGIVNEASNDEILLSNAHYIFHPTIFPPFFHPHHPMASRKCHRKSHPCQIQSTTHFHHQKKFGREISAEDFWDVEFWMWRYCGKIFHKHNRLTNKLIFTRFWRFSPTPHLSPSSCVFLPMNHNTTADSGG